MKKTILLFILYTSALLASIAGLVISYIFKFPLYEMTMSLGSMAIGAIIPYYINFVNDLIAYSPFNAEIKRMIRHKVITDNTEFRISFAYLFRVEIEGRYFLIEDNHHFSRYKVPGGTYLVTETEKNYIKEHFLSREDDKYDNNIKDDYRMYIAAGQLVKFYRRFNNHISEDMGENFKRNIVSKHDYLPKDVFDKVSTRFVRRDFVIKYPKHFGCFELLLADIIELQLTPKQKECLSKLKQDWTKESPYYFATKNDIITRGNELKDKDKNESIISDHTYKILPDLFNKATKIEY